MTRARVVNAVAGLPSPGTLDITAGIDLDAHNLPLGGVTPYAVVSAGDRGVIAAPPVGTGSTPTPLTLTSGESDADLHPNLVQTIVLTGDASATAGSPTSPGPPITPHVIVLTDDVPSTLASNGPTNSSAGLAAIRLVHVDAGSPQPLDLLVNNDRLVGADNITRDNSSTYLLVAAGSVTLTVRRTGAAPSPSSAGVNDPDAVRTATVTLQGGRAYTVFVAPVAGSSTGTTPVPPVITLDQ